MANTKFQIIHNLDNTINEIFLAIKSTFEFYYKELEDDEINSFIELNYDVKSNDKFWICGFSIEIDLDQYDLFDYEKFWQITAEQLFDSENVLSLIKLHDDDRLLEYTDYYQKIAKTEMNLREVITFILADCVNSDFYNLLNGQETSAKLIKVKQGDREQHMISKAENELFYLVFSQYGVLKVPTFISSKYIGELLDSLDANELKSQLSKMKIFTSEYYSDFLARIKDDLKSIETFRNCIAHNRKFTTEEWANYDKAMPALNKAISEFWSELTSTDYDKLELWEIEAIRLVEDLMDRAEPDTVNNVLTIEGDYDNGISGFTADSEENLLQFLEEQAENEAINYMPSDKEMQKMAIDSLDGMQLIQSAIDKNIKKLLILGWGR